MYTFEHWASKLVQDAIFNSSEIHVNLKQILYNNNNNNNNNSLFYKNTSIADHSYTVK